jgi:hypothetical protein
MTGFVTWKRSWTKGQWGKAKRQQYRAAGLSNDATVTSSGNPCSWTTLIGTCVGEWSRASYRTPCRTERVLLTDAPKAEKGWLTSSNKIWQLCGPETIQRLLDFAQSFATLTQNSSNQVGVAHACAMNWCWCKDSVLFTLRLSFLVTNEICRNIE